LLHDDKNARSKKAKSERVIIFFMTYLMNV